ncbi:thioesterase domain-containing protein [Hoeflea marina]|uniref:Thioesterase domain-containing protein n=1 Tax=Hoeflea marina TaxID=274592 RepID=A0A317PRS2_9HYPH|nr:alpha/beta fold hydrolase [Hoeflea marina]PWW03637.1 thioesterase domain-containing protein [Hoeflea marina]
MTDAAEVRGMVLAHMISFGSAANVDLLKAADASGADVEFGQLARFDSVDAVELCMELEARLSVAIDLAEFARVRTLDGFAARVASIVQSSEAREADKAPADFGPHMICMQAGDPGRVPLFLIPGADGSSYAFRHVVSCLSDAVPVYGLQMHGIDGKAMPRLDVREIAADCVDSIRSIKPSGPCRILGYSMGGGVGFEVARLLAAANTGQSHVMMLDSDCPRQQPVRQPFLDQMTDSRFWMRLSGLKRLELAMRDRRNRAKLVPLQRLFAENALRGEAIPMNERESALLSFNKIAHMSHVPGRYDGPVTLLRAAQRPPKARNEPEALGWQQFCDRPVRVITVDADHYTILHDPVARVVAGHVDRLMADQLQADGQPA